MTSRFHLLCCLCFREEDGFLAKLYSWLPTNPVGGAHGPAVGMILSANAKSLQQDEKEKLEAWMQDTYREGDKVVWKGWKETGYPH